MSNEPFIFIDTSRAVAMLKRVSERISRPGLLMASVLESAKRVVHDHFQRLHSERNRYGSGFYARFSRQENLVSKITDPGNTGTLEIKDENGALRHKISGGTVTAKRAKFLTLPVSEHARRESARGSGPAHGGIPGLFFARRKNGRGLFLATENAGRIVVHYLLKKSVTHKPHPEVFPSRTSLAKAVQAACDEFAESL